MSSFIEHETKELATTCYSLCMQTDALCNIQRYLELLGWPTMLRPNKILSAFARGFRNCFPRCLTYHTRFTYLSERQN